MAKAPSEKHLEDWLVENPHAFGCGGDVDYLSLVKRQLRLPSGRLDLLFKNNFYGEIVAVELKQGRLHYEDLHQVLKYMHDLNQIWNHATCSLPNPNRISEDRSYCQPFVNGYLIGYSADELLCRSANTAGVVVMTYDFDGADYELKMRMSEPIDFQVWFDYAYGAVGDAMREAYMRELQLEYTAEDIQRMIAEK